MTEPQDDREKLRPTPPTVVAVAAMLGALASYMFFGTVENLGQSAPRVTAVSWLALAAVAAATAVLAWVTHQQVQRRRERIEPGRAVARLVLGKTALLAGAAFAGGYLTIVALYVPRIAAPLPLERVVNGGIAALCAVVLAVAGWFLERSCVDPRSKDSGDAPPDVR
ncbi:DUF3180 family protein [Propionicicella superfundia]|uniref:DUF3180 family protein n=1 Tax=Propionicicella superfundia TaxID=348582 RepID=UPI000421605D|nr:DUF3180 family protein [Propionicicella superfundia]